VGRFLFSRFFDDHGGAKAGEPSKVVKNKSNPHAHAEEDGNDDNRDPCVSRPPRKLTM
jgi:hypothetical protein